MSASPQPTVGKHKKPYALNQCALFKVGSKKRLAKVLDVEQRALVRLSTDVGNFRVFELAEDICEFTGKRKKARWVQDPIPELKAVHRRIASLLGRIQVPEYCHGATRGRSYRTNASAHLNAKTLANFDLEKFFPSTTAKQIFGFFIHDLRCAPDVAGLLTDLCTYNRVLPTGSPVSPVLAFWANRNLFETLSARSAALNLTISVYVDDVTFSGEGIPRSLSKQVGGIVKKHRHKLSAGKTKLFGAGQAKHVTGVVIDGGKMRVPHSRFQKARAIGLALAAATDDEHREKLAARLSGLLGEAAYLDPRYKRWAKDSVKVLANIKARRKATAAAPPM